METVQVTIIINKKSHVSFRLVLNLVTLVASRVSM